MVGNALLGLHLIKDSTVPERLEAMLEHTEPAFRATAAWVMGKTGDRRYIELLTRLTADENQKVREVAEGALASLPAEACRAHTGSRSGSGAKTVPSRRAEAPVHTAAALHPRTPGQGAPGYGIAGSTACPDSAEHATMLKGTDTQNEHQPNGR